MLRLVAFGGLTLLSEARPFVGAAAGRRRLALLALLVVNRERGIDRDLIANLLWPDSEPDLARHSLDQLIFAMRRAYGSEAMLTGAPTLHLDPSYITSDVWDFDNAVSRRDYEGAVAAYRGPLADGFLLPGADELHRRLDASRQSYARDYSFALDTLARDAESRGDSPSAVRWRRLLVDANPLSAQSARSLIEALVATNERTQALQFARAHEALVRQELDSAPDPEVVRWIRRLRDTPDPGPALSSSPSIGATNDAPTTQASRLNRAVGPRYRIEAEIDDGNLAASYSATELTGQRQSVEIHVIQPRIAAMANGERFTSALAGVARLAHRSIHPVTDIGSGDDVLFYVTPPRSAHGLRDRLARDRELPIGDAITIAFGIAEALAVAHRSGVRHGDLRPKHIDLTPTGPVVASLGVIDAIMPDRDVSDGSTIVTFGSPTYLSPEQLANGRPGDSRSDVYALGCILYEMLAGEPPFGRASRSTGLAPKLTQAPALVRTRRESVPEALERIIHTCLARVPADRYASGEHLARALAELSPTASLRAP